MIKREDYDREQRSAGVTADFAMADMILGLADRYEALMNHLKLSYNEETKDITRVRRAYTRRAARAVPAATTRPVRRRGRAFPESILLAMRTLAMGSEVDVTDFARTHGVTLASIRRRVSSFGYANFHRNGLPNNFLARRTNGRIIIYRNR